MNSRHTHEERTYDTDDAALRECVIFSTLLSGELFGRELRILWEKGKMKVMYAIILLPSFFQRDF